MPRLFSSQSLCRLNCRPPAHPAMCCRPGPSRSVRIVARVSTLSSHRLIVQSSTAHTSSRVCQYRCLFFKRLLAPGGPSGFGRFGCGSDLPSYRCITARPAVSSLSLRIIFKQTFFFGSFVSSDLPQLLSQNFPLCALSVLCVFQILRRGNFPGQLIQHVSASSFSDGTWE